jgi:hypothetical protein
MEESTKQHEDVGQLVNIFCATLASLKAALKKSKISLNSAHMQYGFIDQ